MHSEQDSLITPEWDYPNPFTVDIQVSEQDIDGLNHVNNAVYVKWCEKAGWGHSVAVGLGEDAYRTLDRAMAIRHSEFDYMLPALMGEHIRIGTWLTASDGKVAMERCFQVVRLEDGKTLMRGKWQLVCIEISTGRARRMPDEFLEKYVVTKTS